MTQLKTLLFGTLAALGAAAAMPAIAHPATTAVPAQAAPAVAGATIPAPAQTATDMTPAAAAPATAGDTAATPAAKVATPQFYKAEPGIGQPDGAIHIQPQVTAIGKDAEWMHDVVLMPIITVISLLVLGLLLWVVARYRASANPVASRTSHNTVIEVIWTLAPVLLLVIIAVPSIKLLAAQYAPPKADITVKVIGHQWYWSYQYPDNGDFEVVSNILTDQQDKERGEPRQLGVDERMVVPAGAVVKVIVTSDDVIHSFAVPAFWTKMDAVPGRLNETWFKVDRPGLYYGQCSELCGARHGYMPIAVEVVTKPQFAQWIAAKGGTIGAKATSSDATGNQPASTGAVPSTSSGVDAATPAVASTAAAATPVSQGATANQGSQP